MRHVCHAAQARFETSPSTLILDLVASFVERGSAGGTSVMTIARFIISVVTFVGSLSAASEYFVMVCHKLVWVYDKQLASGPLAFGQGCLPMLDALACWVNSEVALFFG